MDNEQLPDEFAAFHAKLPDALAGKSVLLTRMERMWLAAFRHAARCTERLTTDESFSVSFDALVKCHRKSKSDNYQYVVRACVNTNRNHVRSLGRKHKPLVDDRAAEMNWQAMDVRLDMEEALSKMELLNPDFAKVIRCRNSNVTYTEIAAKMERDVTYIRRTEKRAETCLRRLLGRAYE